MPRIQGSCPVPKTVGSMTVQSILVPATWSKQEAQTWLKKHGYKTKLDVRPHGWFWGARQINPECFQKGSFRTIRFGANGIEAVVGKLAAVRNMLVKNANIDKLDAEIARMKRVLKKLGR